MIASVAGTVAHVGLGHLILEVGGFGVRVLTTPATAAACSLGAPAHLHTSLVVREESLTLYGFADADGQAIFEQVQTVSGVGPRLAQAMLAVHTPQGVRRAISGGDLVALTKVPGIGRKGAERIVLELRDKMKVVPDADDGTADAAATHGSDHPHRDQVIEALVGLGWSTKHADDAVRRVSAPGKTVAAQESADADMAEATAAPAQLDVAGLLRAALRELGR